MRPKDILYPKPPDETNPKPPGDLNSKPPDDPISKPPDDTNSAPPLFTGSSDPPDKAGSGNTSSASHGSGKSRNGLPTPTEAFGDNFKDLINYADVPDRAKNLFVLGDAFGNTLKGWRVKALGFLLAPSNATKLGMAAIRGTLIGVRKALNSVASLGVLIDLVKVFRENRMGSAAFYPKYGMAMLGAIGGILAGAAFSVFGTGILASLGLSGAWFLAGAPIFRVVAPILFGTIGAGLFQATGSAFNQLSQPSSRFYQTFGLAGLGAIAGIFGGAMVMLSLGLTGFGSLVGIPLAFGLVGVVIFQGIGWLIGLTGGRVSVTQPRQQTKSAQHAAPDSPIHTRPSELKLRRQTKVWPLSVYLPPRPPDPPGPIGDSDDPPPPAGGGLATSGGGPPPPPPSPSPLGGVSFDASISERSFRPASTTESQALLETKRQMVKKIEEGRK